MSRNSSSNGVKEVESVSENGAATVLTTPEAVGIGGGLTVQTIDEADVWLKALVYGYPGAGKTYLSATAPKPLFLVSEESVTKETLRAYYRHTGERIPFIDIRSTDDLKRAYAYVANELDKGSEEIQTVVLDSITDMQKMMARDLIREGIERGYYRGRENRNTEVLEQGEWGWLANRTRNMIRSFRNLPCHVVMTAQVSMLKNEAMEAPAIQPSSFTTEAPGLFNMVAKLEVVRNEQGEPVRVLRCDGGGEFVAKNPQSALPRSIRNPNLSQIIELLNAERSE